MTPYSLNFQSVVGNGMAINTGNEKNNQPVSSSIKAGTKNLIQLSPSQTRLWYLCQIEGAGSSYNLIQEFELKGVLEVSTLEQAIQMVIARHPALRTNFVSIKGQVFKQIQSDVKFKLNFLNICNLDHHLKENKLNLLSAKLANHNFDLSNGPLLKINVVWFDQNRYRLMINMHHIISDGWSFEIFKREMSSAYNAVLHGKPEYLQPLPVWQASENVNEVELEQQRDYWIKKFHNAPPLLELPDRKLRPPVQSFQGRRIKFELPQQITEQFKNLCETNRVSNYVGLLTAFKILVSRYTGRRDIVVGTPFSGRHKDNQKQAYIDFFVNTIPLRNQIDVDKSFVEILSEVNSTVHGAFPNQDVSFDKLVECINPDRNPSFSPLFQIMFVFQNYEKQPFNLSNIKIWKASREVRQVKFDLTLEITEESSGQFSCAIDYNSDIYEGIMIHQFVNHYKTILQSICQNPDSAIYSLTLLTDKEYEKIIYLWNDNTAYFPIDKCLHQLFEEQVKRSPNAVALSFEGIDMTYETLNSKANQLAHYLIQNGIQKEDFVAIQIRRSFEMVIAVLGVMKSGGSYVAIDPDYPEERKTFMLLDANAKLLLSTADLLADDAQGMIKSIAIDKDWNNFISPQRIAEPNISMKVSELAYMIYTSGSTGQPKGVLIEHKGIPNLVYDHIRKYDLKQGNCILQFASLSFDASICEIGMALLSGATLCIAKKDQILPGPGLIRLLNRAKISHVTLPPSALSILPDANLPNLKVITVTGEACPEFLIDQWGKGRKFFNGYGPSEVTVGATMSEFKKGSKKTSIGRPFANYQVYLLDAHQNPVPIGVPGEIYVSGIGLARGYFNNKKATNEKFIPCPFKKDGSKMYRTGDIARYLPNGEIEFIGRNDNMVKLRGMRVELGEIETVIDTYQGVAQSKVVVQSMNAGNQQLVAYCATSKKGDINIGQIKKFISNKLPKHMVPSVYIILEKFPKSPNGKIDLDALPPIASVDIASDAEKTSPKGPTEKKLLEIWQKILNLEVIGTNENFFDLGGHSLMAASMVTKIENEFGVVLQVSSLLQYPTIEKLSEHIQENKIEPCCAETIIPIRAHGNKAPVFLFHTPSGNVVSYYKLAENIEEERPVYGVEVDGIAGSGKPYYSMESLAMFYANEIKKFLPAGEIHLAGYCFGGLLAYEVAVALKKQGEQVGRIIVMGSKFPKVRRREVVVGENETMKNNMVATQKNLRSRLFYLKKNLSKQVWTKTFEHYMKGNMRLPNYLKDFKLIHHRMISLHHPSHYQGDMHLILPEDKGKQEKEEIIKSWEQIVDGKVTSHQTLGKQGQLLEVPYAINLAKVITSIFN